jgi:uracil-DNA glycosylase
LYRMQMLRLVIAGDRPGEALDTTGGKFHGRGSSG